MDIKGTSGDDLIEQKVNNDAWDDYHGLAGNDTIRVYQGSVLGGAGNDRIELIPTAEWWRNVNAGYWDSPNGVVVDLAGGWAEDGWGSRDTLVGVRNISGSWQNDRLYGDAHANVVSLGGGHTVADGRDGDDLLWLPVFREGMALSEFKIEVGIDGKSATITWSGRPEFKAQVTNFERIGVGYDVSYALSDFIDPAQMARQGLVGTDSQRWNAGQALGTGKELTYAFVASAPASGSGATGFAAFTDSQRSAVKTILDDLAKVTGLSFRESTADGANLRFGASAQASTKGLATMPGESGAGQVWMDTDSLRYLAPGSEGYAALLHEIGHALGLRHPRNVDAGEAWSAQWREADDRTSYSVMANGASADGLFPSTWGALDITALRHLYGSRTVAAGDTAYTLDGQRFQSQTSIVDDGGTDTIDASASGVGVALDLTPGALSSVGVTGSGIAAVDNLGIAPGSWIENATGSQYDDVMLGNALDNVLRGGAGNDWIEGGAGSDTAVFEGRRADYLFSTGFGKTFITARDGSAGFDTLLGIEKLRFADTTLTLGQAGFAADAQIEVDQNASVAGKLPESSNGAALRYTVKSGPAHGSLSITAGGDYVYTPTRGYAAEDRFTFTVTEAGGGSNDYLGFVRVNALSAAPGGTELADRILGTSGDDSLAAGGGHDEIAGGTGSDRIDGGAGFDIVRYEGARSSFRFALAEDGSYTVDKGAGNDHLVGVERVFFASGAVALDIDGAAGQAYRLYQAAFDRTPDAGGLSFWIYSMDNGSTLESVARGFMASKEFADLYGAAPTPEQFVSKLYSNVLHREPEKAGYDFWVGVVVNGFARSEVLAQFAESAENRAQLIAVMEKGIDYTPFSAG